MSAKNELRFTDTNAASDSKGRTWGLEGGLLVAHRRHRRGHHRFFCPARRPELIAPCFIPRCACAGVGLPCLHLHPAAGQAARLRPRPF